ncbi:GIY-YIG nuclease family protein [Cytobacillus oceanisediminis]|uniref:GIY-YIG nuclease family protein n=1 Tax=Cytobacillus oceanisediminis TaxID=665099 RepID=UPI00119D8467|nr:GIY-YIG nuclease family protein [Cytobacillus oceanisediminis]
MFKKIKELLNLKETIREKESYLAEIEEKVRDRDSLFNNTVLEAQQSIQEEAAQIISTAKEEADNYIQKAEKENAELALKIANLRNEAEEAESVLEKKQKEYKRIENAAKKLKAETGGIKRLIENFPDAVDYTKIESELAVLEASLGEGIYGTVVKLNLHHDDSKALKKEMNANNKEIKKLVESYESRYNTKANKTIYHLMVIGLQAELQNILYTLSYTNLDKAMTSAKSLTQKYLTIAGNGNANILPTITRFIQELEPLFENAIQIEYKYYIQKEKEKEEQRQIREQMRQEAEEQRLLDQERKKIEKEEEKYLNEIEKNKEMLSKEIDLEKIAALEARLKELNEMVEKLEDEKEEIVKRANGKAGYVYVISNLGSFGEKMFKIGMTRRLNPLDRIDELGDASVPFKFDIHAMVFSENAVALEQKMHELLEENRVNKINLRKEFFYADVANLQDLVQEIEPTAEFTLTMKAEEYRQSLSLEEDKLVTSI